MIIWKKNAPCRDRTYDLLIKSQLLYLAELKAHWKFPFFISNEGGRDRTFDHLLKRQMLYH